MLNRNHYIRQSGIIDASKLDFPILVIGAGGIGGWTTLALAKMGCQDIEVMDNDFVEEHNLGSQIFAERHIGELKVRALADVVSSLTTQNIKPIQLLFSEDTHIPEKYKIVISAVDNMKARSNIFNAVRGGYLIDGRMASNEIHVHCVPLASTVARESYSKTLFSDEEASEIPCSERAVVYNVFVVAGLITDMVAQIANGVVPPAELVFDLRNFTLFGGLI